MHIKDGRGSRVMVGVALLGLGLGAAPVLAERPMQVDDARTPEVGEFELEGGWSRDGRLRSWDVALGFAPTEDLKVEVGFVRGRDRAEDPHSSLRGVELELKWVPLQSDVGLSAGIALEYGRTRVDDRQGDKETERERGVAALLSWGFASGQAVLLNLGREWEREDGETVSANTWGIGFEQPLSPRLQVMAEIFGAEHSRPGRQIGLRYEVIDGVTLSGAVGRGNDRTLASLGLGWEF